MILRALQADHDGASATASKASPRTDGSGSRSATAARRREPSVLPRSTRPRKDSKPESSAGTCACASPSGRLWRPWVQALKSEAVGDDNARPGVVAVPQTFGSVLQPHPHLHALASHGVWDQQGQWIPVPYVDTTPAEELFAHKIFRLLKTKGLLSDERMQLLLSFRHSGFSVDASPTVWPQDSHGLERLGRYLLRCPVSLSRIDWTPGSKTLFCQSKASHDNPPLLTSARRESPHLRVHRSRAHTDPRTSQTRHSLFQAYSSKARAHRAERKITLQSFGTKDTQSAQDESPPSPQKRAALRRSWARLIRRVGHATTILNTGGWNLTRSRPRHRVLDP